MDLTATDPDVRLREALKGAGIRVTSQRLVLFRELSALGRHVTADELLGHASERLPGLSAPTVYSTLDLFVRLGLVRRVAGAGNATLYDAGTLEHEHLLCRECGKVVDVPGSADLAALRRAAADAGMAVEDAQVVLQGLCPDCRQA